MLGLVQKEGGDGTQGSECNHRPLSLATRQFTQGASDTLFETCMLPARRIACVTGTSRMPATSAARSARTVVAGVPERCGR